MLSGGREGEERREASGGLHDRTIARLQDCTIARLHDLIFLLLPGLQIDELKDIIEVRFVPDRYRNRMKMPRLVL